MAESSDGESTNRQFKNVKEDDKIISLIKNSLAFGRFCNRVVNKVDADTCITELKRNMNGESFKKYLMIPKNTVIEVNLVDPKLKLFFSYKVKNQEHLIEMYLDKDMITKSNELYEKKQAEKNMQANCDTT